MNWRVCIAVYVLIAAVVAKGAATPDTPIEEMSTVFSKGRLPGKSSKYGVGC